MWVERGSDSPWGNEWWVCCHGSYPILVELRDLPTILIVWDYWKRAAHTLLPYKAHVVIRVCVVYRNQCFCNGTNYSIETYRKERMTHKGNKNRMPVKISYY